VPADFHLRGGVFNAKAKVSEYGEVVVAPYDYSTSYFQNMGTANTAYNFVEPVQGKFFVIRTIILQANKNVNATTGQVVDIYEAESATATTIDKRLIEVEMIKNDRFFLTGLNIRITEGKFINGKTEDDDVLVTVAGFYVDMMGG
jgi:hypothetical protein